MPHTDKHKHYLLCLGKELNFSTCVICQKVTHKAHTNSASHLKAALWENVLSLFPLKQGSSPRSLVLVPLSALYHLQGSGTPSVKSLLMVAPVHVQPTIQHLFGLIASTIC